MANRQIEIENKAMKEILIAMHNLGGQVTRKQVLQELRENSDVFSEKEIDATRTSKKSGKIYHPFQWKFNFAVKHLILAGFIDTENGHDLELKKRLMQPELRRKVAKFIIRFNGSLTLRLSI